MSVTNQHDLIAAIAAYTLAATTTPAATTITLANNVTLAGTITINTPKNSSLTIQGNGFSLNGNFVYNQTGLGTLVLNAADTSLGTGIGSASYEISSYIAGTVAYSSNATGELARPDATGSGLIYISLGSTLRIDGTTMPGNPIDFPYATYGSPSVIDLANIVATSNATTLDSGLGITIPTATGSVLLELDSSAPHNFLLTPDGNGGTFITGTTLAVGNSVTVLGASGAVLSIPINTPTLPGLLQPALTALTNAVATGVAIPYIASGTAGGPAPTLPTVAVGQTLEVIAQTGGQYSLPGAGAPGNAAFVSTVTSAITLAGGAAAAQLVAVGTGGLSFTAGAGYGTVIAGGGSNVVSVPSGSGNQAVFLGNGVSNSVSFAAGNNTLRSGSGTNTIGLGTGQDLITTAGTDTIFGSSGTPTINAATAAGSSDLTFLGFTASTYTSGAGASTVVGSTGNDSIATASLGSAAVFLGNGRNSVTLTGADTLVANSGANTVTATGNEVVFQQSGALLMNETVYASGVPTIVGYPGAATTIQGNTSVGGPGPVTLSATSTPLVYFEVAPTVFHLGSAATVVASGTPLIVTGGAGGGLFIGASSGNNVITGSGAGVYYSGLTQIIGGGNGDTLSAGAGYAEIQAGSGNETLVAGSSVNLFAFVSGRASQVLLQGFNTANDHLLLQGFSLAEPAKALAGATTSGGSESITLTDGTHVTFQGYTGLTASQFS